MNRRPGRKQFVKEPEIDWKAYSRCLEAYSNELEKALDKACNIMFNQMCCKYNEENDKPILAMNPEQWKEWLENE